MLSIVSVSGELVPPSANTASVLVGGIELKTEWSHTPFPNLYANLLAYNRSTFLKIFGLCRATKDHNKILCVRTEVTD